MKFELIDITGNRWFHETKDLEDLQTKIGRSSNIKVIPYGAKEQYQYAQWRLCANYIVSYRQTD